MEQYKYGQSLVQIVLDEWIIRWTFMPGYRLTKF